MAHKERFMAALGKRAAAVLIVALSGADTEARPLHLATFQVAGQELEVTEMGAVHRNTVRVASCGDGVLYATRPNGVLATLWVNLTSGQGTWTQVTAGAPGIKIACDRQHLYALSAIGDLYHAWTNTNGQIDTWNSTVGGLSLAVPAGTTDIQSGGGNLYALAFNSITAIGTLYSSELAVPTSPAGYVQGSASSWMLLANNLGTDRATGAGSRASFTAVTSSLGYRKQNRAFGAGPDDGLVFNDTLLDGQNWWTGFPNAGVNLLGITADSSNTLFALATGPRNTRRILRYQFSENECDDGLDNDANGQVDAEDLACRRTLAADWCSTRSSGTYCIDRLESTDGYSHALVTCRPAGQQPRLENGLCTKGTPGNDFLTAARANNTIFDAGRYCNVINPDGTWDFAYEGETPCATLLRRHPGATIVRAGTYSRSEANNIYVNCNNGRVVVPEGKGTAPLIQAMDTVGHTSNRCVVTVSPRAMRVFNAPFPTSAWARPAYGGRGYGVGHVFDHAPRCLPGDVGCPCGAEECFVELPQFGNNHSGSTTWLDHHGKEVFTFAKDQTSYDFGLNEGTPLRALGWGRVVSSRKRDLSGFSGLGTPYQGEIFVLHDVGDDPTYAESFVAYYAHVGTRVVTTGQTVAPGQLLGYSGTSGASSGPHLHFGLTRLSNTNGRTVAGGEAFGYHVPFRAVTTNAFGVNEESVAGAVDPYGWRAPAGQDPYGWMWADAATHGGVTGIGAWSPILWIQSETPPYP